MPVDPSSLEQKLISLFDAERTARRLHDELTAVDKTQLLPILAVTIEQSKALKEDESALRLVRVAGLLGEMLGDRVVELLISILGSETPEARFAAGEALSALAFDRFKEVALGVERALSQLPPDDLALPELPFLLVEVPEPGVSKLLSKFLQHPNAEVVASAVEAIAELGDPSLVPALEGLQDDARFVDLEDESGESDQVTIGKLAREAATMLSDVA